MCLVNPLGFLRVYFKKFVDFLDLLVESVGRTARCEAVPDFDADVVFFGTHAHPQNSTGAFFAGVNHIFPHKGH